MSKRPKYHDEETRRIAVEKLIPSVLDWLGQRGDVGTADEIREDLINAIDYHDDGYEVCRQLESWHHWAVDAALVDILDNTAHYRHRALSQREEEWVVATGLKPTYKVGDTLSFPYQDKNYTGSAYEVDTKLGKYAIFCIDLGHVIAGCGTHGVWINFEDIIEEAR